MPEIRLVSRKTGREDWCPIDGAVIDRDGYLQFFGIQMPGSERYYHLHVVRHKYPLADLAEEIFSSRKQFRIANRLCEEFEEYAAENGWYDAERYPAVARHAGKAGMVFVSAIVLCKFLESQPFDKEGYYTANRRLILGPPIDTEDENEYRQ